MRLLLAVCGVVAGCALSLGATGELSGRRAPGFALPDSTTRYHDLADYRGKVVLLDIMQSRCPNCEILTRTLKKVKATYGGRVAILSVVVPPDNQATVAAYISRFKVTTPILFDCGQMTSSYMKASPRRPRIHLPHLFLIDREGVIRNDFDHTERAIFEGRGLFEEIERLLGAGSGAKKKR